MHTCIYKTTYNDTYHWEECMLCGTQINKKAHNKVDNWVSDTIERCHTTNQCTTYCKDNCGYSKIWRESHTTDSIWDFTTIQGWYHGDNCTVCGMWAGSDACIKSDGSRITCNNLGTCAECGYVWNSKRHFFYPNGICQICGEKYMTTEAKLTYFSSDRKKCTITVHVVPSKDITITEIGTFSGSGGIAMSDYNVANNVKKNADGSYDITYNYNILNETYQIQIYAEPRAYFTLDGAACEIHFTSLNINPDNVAPSVTNVTQTDIASSNGWTTSKKITVTGSEAYSDAVYVKLTNASGTVIYPESFTSVTNGSYSFSFIPEMEAQEATTFYVCVRDRTGNESKKAITVSKIDSQPPTLINSTEYINPWAKERTITFQATDNGVGNVSIAFNDESDYQLATYNSSTGKWERTYRFIGNVGKEISATLYLKDGLNNKRNVTLKFNQIDGVNPTINVTTKSFKAIATIKDNLSGVNSYAIIKQNATVTDSDWKTIAATNSTEISTDDLDVGDYTFLVRDQAKNIGQQNFSLVPKSIDNGIIQTIGKIEYDGLAKEPTPVILVENITLVRGLDYSVSYSNNIDSGIVKVSVTGIGNYTGTLETEFLIYVEETEVDVTGLITENSVGTHNCNNYAVDKYDTNYHWKECTICSKEYVNAGRPDDTNWENTYLEIVVNVSGERILVIKDSFLGHIYTSDYWTILTANGTPSCSSSNKHKYVCDCGFEKTTTDNIPAHQYNSYYSINYKYHVKLCNICKDYQPNTQENHTQNGVEINCINGSGTCDICNGQISNNHYESVAISPYEKKYTSSSTCLTCGNTIFDKKYLDTSITNNGIYFSGYTTIYTNQLIQSVNMPDRDDTYYGRGKITSLIPEYQVDGNYVKMTYEGYFVDTNTETTDIVGVGILITAADGKVWSVDVWNVVKPDAIAPTMNVTQSYTSVKNGWITNNQITINGEETYGSSVKIEMKEVDTNQIIYTGNTSVKDGKYSYTFTPNIAIDVDGKQYEIIVKDTLENKISQIITIDKTDRLPPIIQKGTQLDSKNVWSTPIAWSKSKEFVMTATDEGSQVARIKFQNVNNSQTGYDFTDVYGITNRDKNVNPILNTREYKFIGDVTNYVTATIYLQDEAGNEATDYVRIYNLDNTPPVATMIGINDEGKIIGTIAKANVKDNGSGLKYFAVTEISQTVAPTTRSTTNTSIGTVLNQWYPVENLAVSDPNNTNARNINIEFNGLLTGTYKLWTEDLLGNQSVIEFKIENEPLITEWKIPVGGTIKLPIPSHTANEYFVDWGDGNTNSYTTEAFPTHTYTNTVEKNYTIKVSGKVNTFGNITSDTIDSNSNYYIFTQYLVGLKDWGKTEAIRYGFANCKNLMGEIPTPREETFINTTSMENLFYGCENLGGTLSSELFKYAKKVTSFDSVFEGCKTIKGSIPADLFAQNSLATDYDDSFKNCIGLTGNISETLFTSNTTVTSFAGTFSGCSGLSGTIPGDLFAKHGQVTTFENVFKGCSGITGTIPSNIFAKNAKVTSFNNTFNGCAKLTGLIPVELFKNNSLATNYEGTFADCGGLKGGELRLNTATVTNMNSMFSGCTSLENIVLGEDFKNLNGSNMFENCSTLRAIIMLNNPDTLSDVGTIASVDTLGLASGTKIYVPYEEDESLYEQKNTNVDNERIEQVIEAIEPNPDHVGLHQEYIDPGYTVAGYTIDEKAAWEQYGFYVEVRGNPVDTSEPGSEWIKYILKRN